VQDSPEGRGSTGTALREGKYLVANDIANDMRLLPWKTIALNRGYRSSMSLPIKKFGKVVGVFSFYTDIKNFFDTAEIALLEEATGDVGFALEIFEKEALRKQAEEEVLQSEIKYRTLIEQASDGIFIADENGRYEEVNSRGCQLLGWSKEEIIGLYLKDFVVMDEDFVPLRTAELKAGKTVIQKRKLRTKEGAPVWVEISARLLPGGKMLGMVRDLSERIEAEQKLQKEKELSDKVINSLPGIFYLSDSTPRLLRWNKAMEDISGYTTEELEKIMPIALFDPEDHATLRQGIEKTYRSGTADVEVRMLTKNGQRIPYFFTGAAIDYNGKPAMLGTGIDISERKKAAELLKESEEKYRILFYNNPMPCWIIDTRTSTILDVNDAALGLYGYSRDEFLSMNVLELRSPDHYDRYKKHLERMLTDPVEGNIGVWQHSKKDGTQIDVDLWVHGILYNNIECRMVLASDITEQKKAQDEIIKEKNLSDSIINSLPGVFYLFNKEGKFLRWNTNLEKVTHYSGDEISHMNPMDFFDDIEKPIIFQTISSVFISGEATVEACFLSKIKEKVPYYFTGTAIEYEGSPCLMGVGIDFSERVKAQEEIKETSEQLRQLTAHLQNIREEERKRIGREIHDELGQQLTAIKMDVVWVDKKIPEETVVLKSKLKNVIQLLDNSNQSIRRILSELRPNILDDHGLLEAVEWLGNQFTQHTGVPIKFSTAETQLILPEQITTCVFRLYQEALTNITKYAHATSVLTSLYITDENIIFNIEDDGQGFDPALEQSKKSFGILGMKERVLLLGGHFELIAAPGKGTKINISIPLI
jgi:PAS domain S-box-containing protein